MTQHNLHYPNQPQVVLLTSRGQPRKIGLILLDVANDLRTQPPPTDPHQPTLDTILPPGSILQIYVARPLPLSKRQPPRPA